MTPGQPDVINQLPAGGNPMKPSSGTYGDVANLERLKGQLDLPGTDAGSPSQTSAPPAPGAPTGGTPSPVAPGTVPDVLMAPTRQPDVPAATPLGGNVPTPMSMTGAQRRLQYLDTLANSPEVSEETQEWARGVLRALAGRKTK